VKKNFLFLKKSSRKIGEGNWKSHHGKSVKSFANLHMDMNVKIWKFGNQMNVEIWKFGNQMNVEIYIQ